MLLALEDAHRRSDLAVPHKAFPRLVAIGLVGTLFTLLVTTVPQLSLTADEPVYIAAGYAFLTSGDPRMATATQHPPLMQELVALPLMLQPGPDLNKVDGWQSIEMARFAPAFVSWYGEGLEAATFAARTPVVWIALLWAAFLFRWATDWFGPWGGLVALTVFVFDPNIVAHATLATNDVGFATFTFITLYGATRLLRQRSPSPPIQGLGATAPAKPSSLRHWPWRYLVLTGLALGCSLSSKSSGVFTILVLALLFPLSALGRSKERPQRIVQHLLQLLFIVTLGLLVLWATYGFEVRPLRADAPALPLATQWEVWRETRTHLAKGHTGYMLGQISDRGWLGYYPLAFILKTPPPTLLLLALGLVATIMAGPRRWIAQLPLWIFFGGYLGATLISKVSIGYRFLLPLLPYCFILIAALFHRSFRWLRSPALRWGIWASLILLGLMTVVRIHPDYLTYFNSFAGGPAQGYRYLVDSNNDWGQSFKALQTYLTQEEIEQVWLSHYTYTDPTLYGINYRAIAPSAGAAPILPARFNPAPGVYAIGATTLQGVMTVDPDTYSWFRHRQPTARPGNAIFVYQVLEDAPKPSWLAQCSQPVAPLSPDEITAGFGRDDLRVLFFDCTTSWLYPTGGRAYGAYALHHDAIGDPFVKQRLETARLSYEQRVDQSVPAFVIYEQAGELLEDGCARLPGTFQGVGPISLDGPLDFLGYTLGESAVHPGDTFVIETCWRVTASPERLLSLMLHLVGPGDAPVIVGDGLGVPIESWQVGDVFVQRHQLTLPADAPAADYAVRTGAYWLDTLERWSIRTKDGPAGDQVSLSSIAVVASR